MHHVNIIEELPFLTLVNLKKQTVQLSTYISNSFDFESFLKSLQYDLTLPIQ